MGAFCARIHIEFPLNVLVSSLWKCVEIACNKWDDDARTRSYVVRQFGSNGNSAAASFVLKYHLKKNVGCYSSTYMVGFPLQRVVVVGDNCRSIKIIRVKK